MESLNSSDLFSHLHANVRLPRLSQAKHAIQHVAASIISLRRSHYISACRGDPTIVSSQMLQDWTDFTNSISNPSTDHWWDGCPPVIRQYAADILASAMFLPSPSVEAIDDPIPDLTGPVDLADAHLHDFWEALCAAGAFALARSVLGRSTGLVDQKRHIFVSARPLVHANILVFDVSCYDVTFRAWWQDSELVALCSSHPFTARVRRTRGGSNFLPGDIRWPRDSTPPPSFHVTTLAQRKAAWIVLLGPFLGPAALAILHEGFVIPRAGRPPPPTHEQNHPTVDNDPALIDRIIAKYLLCGIVEHVPASSPPPQAVHALGLVPKKSTDEPWRIIHDCRPENRSVIDWPTNLAGTAASHFIFSRFAWVFTLDLKAAYYTIPLKGCGGGLRRLGGRRPDGSLAFIMGCSASDGTCVGGCDKDRLGFQWRGEYFRMNCSPFGGKVSGNALKVMTDTWSRRWKRLGLRHFFWVDDLCCVIPNPHPPFSGVDPRAPLGDLDGIYAVCAGPDSCPHCLRSFPVAEEVRSKVVAELHSLGWSTNDKDSGPCSMQGRCVGTTFDTFRDAFLIPSEYVGKLDRRVAKLLRLSLFSRRRLSKFRGKLVWFSCAIRFTDVMTRHMSAWIGNPSEPTAWDADDRPASGAFDELRFWEANLAVLATRPRSITRINAAFAYRFWSDDRPRPSADTPLAHSLDIAGVVFVDASVHGYAFAWYAAPDAEPRVLVRGPPPVGPWDEQVHREAFAFIEALRFAAPLAHGRAFVAVSDCMPVVRAADRGSRSAELHAVATSLVHLSLAYDVFVWPMWVPGDAMIEVGVDELSRRGAESLQDVTLPSGPLQLARNAAVSYLGALPTVDWFASSATRTLPRFWSRFPDEGAEGCDALTSESWSSSMCSCGRLHTEIGYFFPPPPLLASVWAKIKVDGAQGVMILPVTPGASWWPLLEESKLYQLDLGPAASLFSHVTHHSARVYRSDTRWALVVFRYRAAGPDSVCSQACARFTSGPLPAPSPARSHAANRLGRLAQFLPS